MCWLVWCLILISLSGELLSTLSSLQTEDWLTWTVPLPAISEYTVLIELSTKGNSEVTVPALLSASQDTMPIVEIERDGRIQFQGLRIDVTGFAYRSQFCHLSIEGRELNPEKPLFVGVLVPGINSQGVEVSLALYRHSKIYAEGEKCPFDCHGHGQCFNGKCECVEFFTGVDCLHSYRTLYATEGEGLIIPAKAYSLVKPSYSKGQNLGVSLELIQGEAMLAISYGL